MKNSVREADEVGTSSALLNFLSGTLEGISVNSD
jgi:hypothetical protein